MTKFWLVEPTVLMKEGDVTSVWPSSKMNLNEKLNAMTRLTIILTITGYILTKKIKFLVSGIVTVLAIVILYGVKNMELTNTLRLATKNEGFENNDDLKGVTEYTEPNPKNPIMNVMMHEIHDNPNRKPAAPSFNPVVETKINESAKKFVASNFDDPNIETKLFKDLGDNFNFDQSMRAWYPTANTQVPNDQKGFAEFCYGNMVSCKDGHELACLKSTPHRWTTN
ncbi:MAG: hypothetical protein CMH58_07890 [Myxococcales bacterium]|nr:hypothetical protein [Myxococcales bacterium]|tara:strand:+ start:7253 stop:7927 length:675 start_codon:yes stop_codon:yes gene_type:complete